MPTVAISKVEKNVTSQPRQILPVITSIVGGNSGVLTFKLIRTLSELDLYFPDITNRDSYVELINNGAVLYLGRVSKSDEDLNKSNLLIGFPGRSIVSSRNLYTDYQNEFSKSRYTFFTEKLNLDKNSVYALNNRSNTLSYNLTLTGIPNNGDYFVLPTEDNNAGVLYLFVDGNNINFPPDIKRYWVTTTKYVQRKSTISEQLTEIKNVIFSNEQYGYSNKVYNEITSNSLFLAYDSPKLNYSFSGLHNSKIDIDYDYNLNRCLFDSYDKSENDFDVICEIVSKIPGVSYDRINIEFQFPNLFELQVNISYDNYAEVFSGDFDSSSANYIVDLINNNSKIINFSWYAGNLENLTGFTGSTTIEKQNKFRSYLTSNSLFILSRANILSYTIGDWTDKIAKINQNVYSSYMLLDDKPFEDTASISIYHSALIERAKKYNVAVGINWIKGETLTNYDYEYLFVFGDKVSTENNLKPNILSIIPVVSLISQDIYLGEFSYNILETLDILQPDGQVESSSRYFNKYTKGIPNRLDELYSTNRDTTLTAKIALLKVMKTITGQLKEAIPDVAEIQVNEILNNVRLMFAYIDSIGIYSYEKTRLLLKLTVTITSVKLCITNKKLNIEINL